MSKFTRALNQRRASSQVSRRGRGAQGTAGVFTHPPDASGTSAASMRTPDRPAADRAPRCKAIKKNDSRCRREAGADGFCRWHRMNVARGIKEGRTIVKVNPFTGDKNGTGGSSWRCPQCGDGPDGTVEERHSDAPPAGRTWIGVAHVPENARECQLCGTRVVHWVRLGVARFRDEVVLLDDCQHLPVHRDIGRHSDGSPCYWATSTRQVTICHPDWEASCRERSRKAISRLYA